jgi:hypothetical protein
LLLPIRVSRHLLERVGRVNEHEPLIDEPEADVVAVDEKVREHAAVAVNRRIIQLDTRGLSCERALERGNCRASESRCRILVDFGGQGFDADESERNGFTFSVLDEQCVPIQDLREENRLSRAHDGARTALKREPLSLGIDAEVGRRSKQRGDEQPE